MAYSLDDYVDVAERIRMAKELYPDFRLQSSIWFDEIAGVQYVICKSEFYRDANDTRPAQGHAWEIIPGKTPYTKGSEIMVCETSSWGRSLVAAGIGAQRVASADEVKAAKARQTPAKKAPDQVAILKAKLMQLGATDATSALAILFTKSGHAFESFDAIDNNTATELLSSLHE